MNATTKALLVMVLDPHIRAWLVQNDRKALEQALVALKNDPDSPDLPRVICSGRARFFLSAR